MLASLACYNMLSNINKNVYMLVVNPSKYFTNQDVWANMPIIFNYFFNFLNGQFQWSKMSMYSIVLE